MRSCTAAIAVLLALAGSPTVAWAQAGWYVTPTLTLTQEYDDNVFGSSSNKKSDFISRATPGVTAGYQSTPFTILGSYAFDAEYFADLSDLTDVGHRQRGELEIRYRPDPRLTLSFSGAYTLSKTTSEFLVSPTTAPAAASQAPASQTPAGQPQATQTSATQQAPAQEPITPGGPTVSGVNVGRTRTEVITVAPSVSYQLDPLTSVDTGYAYTRTDVEGTGIDTLHAATIGVGRQLTPLDRGTLRYRFRFFDSDQAESTTSHAILAGWGRQLTERTLLTLEAGPRISEGGDFDAEALARLEHRFELTTVALGYSRTESLVVGRTGAATIDTGSLAVKHQLLRELVLDLVGSVSRFAQAGVDDTTTYTASAALSYQLTAWLVARLNYIYSRQEQGSLTIDHQIVGLSLDFSYPIRVD